MSLSSLIEAARGNRSRERFASDLGVSLATVIRWESGRTRPTSYQHIESLLGEGVDRSALLPDEDSDVAA